MDHEEREHLEEIHQIYQKLLWILEKQAAPHGSNIPPATQIEIEETHKLITKIEERLAGKKTATSQNIIPGASTGANSHRWVWLILVSAVILVIVLGYWAATRIASRTSQPTVVSNGGYFDFEATADKDKWKGSNVGSIDLSTKQAFSGNNSVAVTTLVTKGMEGGQIFAHWRHSFKADVVIGQVYWPRQDGVQVLWAQICLADVGYCRAFPVRQGQWNTFVLNLYNENFNDTKLDQSEFIGLWIQGGMRLTGEPTQYTFFVDGIQVYPSQ